MDRYVAACDTVYCCHAQCIRLQPIITRPHQRLDPGRQNGWDGLHEMQVIPSSGCSQQRQAYPAIAGSRKGGFKRLTDLDHLRQLRQCRIDRNRHEPRRDTANR